MWPWTRRARRTAGDAGPVQVEAHRAAAPARARRPVFSAEAPPPGWALVPPMAPLTAPMSLTAGPRSFRNQLVAPRESRITAEPLGHVVSPEAPTGRVEGLAVLQPVVAQRAADPAAAVISERPDLTYATPPRRRRSQKCSPSPAPMSRRPESFVR